MATLVPSALASDALARRLADLTGDERNVQVEFLFHVDEFDRRRAWADAGYPSLWDYLLRVLHLREGAAYRRIAAMKVLRRLPRLASALRDGRLCLSTIALHGPVLTEENADDLLARAAFGTKAEVEKLVAALAPRAAPKDGLRKLPDRSESSHVAALPQCAPAVTTEARNDMDERAQEGGPATPARPPASIDAPASLLALAMAAPRPTVRAMAEGAYALRVTLDSELKADLDELTALLGHKVPTGDLAAVLGVALRCAIEKYGKRKGARAPAQERRKSRAASAEPPEGGRPEPVEGRAATFPEPRTTRSAIPAAVRREVWRRDGGRCTYVSPDGQLCPAKARLEFDHIQPVALGGESTVGNIRLACRAHNLLHAERVFGRDHMARFRRMGEPELTSPGRSGGGALGVVGDGLSEPG